MSAEAWDGAVVVPGAEALFHDGKRVLSEWVVAVVGSVTEDEVAGGAGGCLAGAEGDAEEIEDRVFVGEGAYSVDKGLECREAVVVGVVADGLESGEEFVVRVRGLGGVVDFLEESLDDAFFLICEA